MALTAAIRSLLIGLIATGLTWLATTLAVELDVTTISETIGTAIFVVASGLTAYIVNKLGNRWPWVNQILSLWRAKTGAIFVPNDQESVTATATPTGQVTDVVVEDAGGRHLAVSV